MIRAKQKQKIIKVFGVHYASKLSTALALRGSLNQKGKPFSNDSVLKMVNDPTRCTPDMAIAIMVVTLEEERRLEELQQKIKKMI